MKKFTSYFLFLLILVIGIKPLKAQTVDPNALDGEIFFQLKASAPVVYGSNKDAVALNQVAFLDTLKNAFQITKLERPFYMTDDAKLQRTYLLHFKNIHAVDSLIHVLERNKAIAYAEKAPLFKAYYTPNDPDFNGNIDYDWYLKLIQAEKAWDIQKGNPNIKVAIIDNAVDVSHPDLKNKIVAEIDLANGDTDPTPPSKTMEWSHGTHTSGLAGAETDNGVGIASIGFNVSLMAVKVAPDSTDGSTMYYGYQGMVWAADHGANVENLSWGGPGYDKTGQEVVNYVYNKGCVIVAAAGNDGNSTISYPAGYNHVISVAATNSDDSKASFSQYGSTIDVCAPGGSYSNNNGTSSGIYSTVYYAATDYGYMQGTSMASPIVAGLCGLMLSEDSLLTPDKLEAILKATCDNIDAENANYTGELGAGRVNAYKALQAVQDTLANQTVVANFEASNTYIPEGDNVNFTDKSSGNPTSWQWTFEGGTPATSTKQNPTNILYSKPGTYKVSLTVSDGTHSNTETKTNFIQVYPLVTGAWIPQATGFSATSVGIDYISIVNPDTVWADAYDGSGQGTNLLEFTKTTDGGNTWTPGSYSGVPSSCTVSSITAVSASQAWIATFSSTHSDQGIYVTTNGGSSWTKQTTAYFSLSSSFPDGVYFWDKNNGICFGDPISGYFEIYTTTDGGTTWTKVPTSNIPVALNGEYGYVSLYAVSGNTFWFGTNKGRVFKSTDRGQNWTVSNTGMTEVTTLGFHNSNDGVATYLSTDNSGNITNFSMVKTTDGGSTWTAVNPTGTYYKTSMAVVPNKDGMLVSVNGLQDITQDGSAYSLDEGNTWTQLDDSIQYTSVKFYNDKVGWAGGFNSSSSRGIWKWQPISPTGVTELPVNGIKIKVYPNPSVGTVHFHIPKSESVIGISVYDLSGKLVSRLENNTSSAGKDYVMNLRNLKAGVYVAVVRTKQGISKLKLVLH